MKTINRQLVIDEYLEFVNNYLTPAVFAEHRGITEELARAIIFEGRKLHEESLAAIKQYLNNEGE